MSAHRGIMEAQNGSPVFLHGAILHTDLRLARYVRPADPDRERLFVSNMPKSLTHRRCHTRRPRMRRLTDVDHPAAEPLSRREGPGLFPHGIGRHRVGCRWDEDLLPGALR